MEAIFTILFILAVVWSVGLLFKRFNLPLILGELLAGLIIGPPLLGLVGPPGSFFVWIPALDVLATLGMFFLMFYAGLVTDPGTIIENIKTSFKIGILGTVFPLILGMLITWFFTHNFWIALIIGIAISSTSLVTKTRILGDLNILKSKIGHIMVGGALVDNIFTFIIIAVAIKAITTGTTSFLDLGYTLVLVAVFFGVVLFIGRLIYPKVGRFFAQRGAKGFTFALVMGLLIAGIGHLMGLHLIIGAYLAGLFVREEFVGAAFKDLKRRFHTLSHGFLGPIFIVSVAFHVSFGVFWTHTLFLIGLLAAAMIGKMVGASGGAYLAGFKKKEALSIGVAMNGRGTTELILAMIGLELGILANIHVSLLIFVAFITTLLVPIGLKYVISKHPDSLRV